MVSSRAVRSTLWAVKETETWGTILAAARVLEKKAATEAAAKKGSN